MNFGEHNISTQTLIISTNLIISCENLYNSINCVNISKPQNGKFRMLVNESDCKLEDGTIVFVQYKNEHKGTVFKKISEKYFLNSVTIIMKIEKKYINIKVSNKGKLQITGCNKTEYAIEILKRFWDFIKIKPNIWKYQDESCKFLSTLIIPVMCNINFSIDFQINRKSLSQIINMNTDYDVIFEPSDGYVGVNIKIVTKEESLEDVYIDQYDFIEDEWKIRKTKFMEYIYTLNQKEQKKKIVKSYGNTFLVFYSGKVIMSGGISQINRQKAYDIFMNIINTYKNEIKSTGKE